MLCQALRLVLMAEFEMIKDQRSGIEDDQRVLTFLFRCERLLVVVAVKLGGHDISGWAPPRGCCRKSMVSVSFVCPVRPVLSYLAKCAYKYN